MYVYVYSACTRACTCMWPDAWCTARGAVKLNLGLEGLVLGDKTRWY